MNSESPCKCTATGTLKTAPDKTSAGGASLNGDPQVDALCDWACSHAFCPTAACKSSADSGDVCQWDPQKAESWGKSGADVFVDNYIQAYGNSMHAPIPMAMCGYELTR